MKQEFSINRNSVTLNFTSKYCTTSDELLSSIGFRKILNSYLIKIGKKDTEVYKHLKAMAGDKDIADEVIHLFKLLIVFDIDSVEKMEEKYKFFFTKLDVVQEFVEELYNYWRHFERYAIIRNKKFENGLQNANFFNSMNNFTNLVLATYRKIEETVMKTKNRVYRQLPAGVNLGVIVSNVNWSMPKEYYPLEKVNFINSVILQPPFITYPKQNTRKGVFKEVNENPIEGMYLNSEDWLCYPAKVGSLLAFIYFNKDFMAQGVTLSNLFELAEEEEYVNKKPDIIFVYGARDFDPKMKTLVYHDKINDIMVGYINYSEEIDYFGYVKKMTLTLHNMKMISEGWLPIHGAMVNVTMKTGDNFNIVIMGDSGAGKSESLEAFRVLSEEYVKEMKVIFDDMGVFKIKDNKIVGYGTEIGAFVRLDDLDAGYAYKQMDRSIFMNPNKVNSRVVIPISTYSTIMTGYPIEYFLYANNYEEGEELEFFKTPEEAKEVFVAGKRMAKGTTSEKGLVTSYFANPFGPVQKQKETDVLIDKFFKKMFEDKVMVGQIRTMLGIKGMEHEGPIKAAEKLFNLIIKK